MFETLPRKVSWFKTGSGIAQKCGRFLNLEGRWIWSFDANSANESAYRITNCGNCFPRAMKRFNFIFHLASHGCLTAWV
jgi:hypothetical protein